MFHFNLKQGGVNYQNRLVYLGLKCMNRGTLKICSRELLVSTKVSVIWY